MAYCKWVSNIKAVSSVTNVVDYVENKNKTHNSEYAQPISNVIEYVENVNKTYNSEYNAPVAIRYHSDDEENINDEWKGKVLNTFTDEDDHDEKEFFVSGINCSTDKTHKQFMEAQKMNDKPIVNYAYHAVQSFKEGADEMTAETAHEIGVRLAKELWGDEFMVLVATHLNTDHYHNHFVICSTSPFTGKRFHKCDSELRRMRNKSDELCREYGLDVIDRSKSGKRKSLGERKAEEKGQPTHRSILKADCDVAIAQSSNWEEFLSVLRKMGYHVKQGNKAVSLSLDDWQRSMRIYFKDEDARKHGSEYSRESIERRIKERLLGEDNAAAPLDDEQEVDEDVFYDEEDEFDYKYEQQRASAAKTAAHVLPETDDECSRVNVVPNVDRKRFKGSVANAKAQSGNLMISYYRITYKLCLVPMPCRPKRKRRMSVYMRNEVNKLHRYLDQTSFLAATKIKTEDGLKLYKEHAAEQIDGLTAQRDIYRRKLRTCKSREEQAEIRDTISSLTDSIKLYRKRDKLCDEILENSRSVKQAADSDTVREFERYKTYNDKERDTEKDIEDNADKDKNRKE